MCGTEKVLPVKLIREVNTCSLECKRRLPMVKIIKRIETEQGAPLRDVLLRLYVQEERTTDDICRILRIGRSGSTLNKLLELAGIPKRTPSESVALQWKGNEERRRKAAEGMSRRQRAYFAAGGKPLIMSEEARRRLSLARRGPGNPMYGRRGPLASAYGKVRHGKAGWRPDLGMVVFSRWEANFIRVLNYQGIAWEYEPKAFPLILPDGRQATYIPDFRIGSRWVELKGYWRPDAREKVEAFRQQYPGEHLVILEAEHYRQIEQRFRPLIPTWEVSRAEVGKDRVARTSAHSRARLQLVGHGG